MKLSKLVLVLSLISLEVAIAHDIAEKPLITRETCEMAIDFCAEEFMTDLLAQMNTVKLVNWKDNSVNCEITKETKNDTLSVSRIKLTPWNTRRTGNLKLIAEQYANSSDFIIKWRLGDRSSHPEFDIRALPIVKFRVLHKGRDAEGGANFKHDHLAIEKILIPEGPDKEGLVGNETKLVSVFSVDKEKFVKRLQQLLDNPPVEVVPGQQLNEMLGIKETTAKTDQKEAEVGLELQATDADSAKAEEKNCSSEEEDTEDE